MKLINYIRIVFKKGQMKGFRSEFNPTKLANLFPLFSQGLHYSPAMTCSECCAELPMLVNYYDYVALALGSSGG